LSLEVSQRGMSAVVCGAPPVGETVVISLPLPGAPFAGLAVVRYSSATCCGFEFLSMTAEVKARIKAWIEELQGQQYPPYSYLRAALTGVSSDS
jgi:hypothetical protein